VRRRYILGSVFVSFAVFGSTASEIVRYGEERLRGDTAQTLLSMKIVRPTYTRELKLQSWTVGNQKSLIRILEPAKEEGVVSLRVGEQMWNYLPKADHIIRVPSTLMLQSWMGSDFTNDDLMKLSSLGSDYEHKILRTEKLAGEMTTLIECAPKPNAPVVWGKILYWARPDKLPVKEDFYDENGQLIRTLSLSDFKKMDDRVIPTRLKITKAESPGESTVVIYEKALFNRPIEDSLFDKEQLKAISRRKKDFAEKKSATPTTGS